MTKRLLIIFILAIVVSSCKSSKKAKNKKITTSQVSNKNAHSSNENIVAPNVSNSKRLKELSQSEKIVKFAKQFKGVKYKWGGTSKSGMDCSGLVYESFRSLDIYLPRISRDMAKKGKKIKLKDVKVGDLLFFKTKNRRNAINHVGLVTKSNSKTLEFIHSTSSKGVIISKLSESYWNKAFFEARRIL